MSSHYQRKSPIVPLGLLAVVLMALLALTSSPFVLIQKLDQEKEENQSLLQKLHLQTIIQERLKAENGHLAGQDQQAMLLKGETTGIAGANLQKLISDLVVKSNGIASSFQLLPPKPEGGLIRISMSLSIVTDMRALRDIIYGIEASLPLIFIEHIKVRPQLSGAQDSDPYFLGPLDVSMQVSGFVLNGKAS